MPWSKAFDMKFGYKIIALVVFFQLISLAFISFGFVSCLEAKSTWDSISSKDGKVENTLKTITAQTNTITSVEGWKQCASGLASYAAYDNASRESAVASYKAFIEECKSLLF
jgi:hypothetical protein